ncbi:hypothetical protein [Burkholderia alba]|uniref:hypothetical protein n=1 Tax=Burkholderia alba TaxID=2683677 RepID=UPI002B05A4BD|nr:hypothetical protein [Burkholderia alba]
MHSIARTIALGAALLFTAAPALATPAADDVPLNLFNAEAAHSHGARAAHAVPPAHLAEPKQWYGAAVDAASLTATNPEIDRDGPPSPADLRRRQIEASLGDPAARDFGSPSRAVPTTAFEMQQRDLAEFHRNRLRYAPPQQQGARYAGARYDPSAPIGESRTYFNNQWGGKCTSSTYDGSARSSCTLPW